MTVIFGEINGEKYERLIKYLFTKCDSISFFVSDFSETWYTQKNISRFPNRVIVKKNSLSKNENSLDKYVSKMENDFPLLFENYKKKHRDVEYYHTLSDRTLVIYEVPFDEKVLHEFLLKQDGLYSFQYPKLPEDLCFFRGNTLLFSSVSHEKMCSIEDNVDEVKRDLIELGIFKQEQFL